MTATTERTPPQAPPRDRRDPDLLAQAAERIPGAVVIHPQH